MPPLKLHIEKDTHPDYVLIGISCHLKDYRLVYEINKELKLDFKKCEELVIYPVKGRKENRFSCYECKEEFDEYIIVANRNPEGVLISEHKQVDYVLIIKGQIDSQKIKSIIKLLTKIPRVLTSYEINTAGVKNIDVILSDLELHLMEMQKKK